MILLRNSGAVNEWMLYDNIWYQKYIIVKLYVFFLVGLCVELRACWQSVAGFGIPVWETFIGKVAVVSQSYWQPPVSCNHQTTCDTNTSTNSIIQFLHIYTYSRTSSTRRRGSRPNSPDTSGPSRTRGSSPTLFFWMNIPDFVLNWIIFRPDSMKKCQKLTH